jgi:hypothetical protein
MLDYEFWILDSGLEGERDLEADVEFWILNFGLENEEAEVGF